MDICDLILEEHAAFRRRFAEIDESRIADIDNELLHDLWRPLGTALMLHADAEEQLFYPELLKTGSGTRNETKDAIRDHNKIKEAIDDSWRCVTGEADWWNAVTRARNENSDHMAEEEVDDLPDFRARVSAKRRQELVAEWYGFMIRHETVVLPKTGERDPDAYVDSVAKSK